MKAVARSYLWWPGMDNNLEETVRACERCQQHSRSLCRTVHRRTLLVIADAFSKWLDVYATQSATTEVVIEKLTTSFAIHGIPERLHLVLANGTCFMSSEFRTFCKSQEIIHTKSAPYHPSSNGLAKRVARTLKDGLRKLATGSLNEKCRHFCWHTAIRRTPPQAQRQQSYFWEGDHASDSPSSDPP
ncbi:uncharacterized protein LOC134190066 [Corticium candelabrum]|uniref:uncharacterized protein LOC134190066 n=1 Tax=Corticium candelabrum TaxID=121492 RepID=UPI002E26ED7D|nr:uncharacterized protein LOC134190066 [Corticium candelabrum]